MARLSKAQQLALYEKYAAIYHNVAETSQSVVKTIVEEGLWIALSADLFMVTGELNAPEDDFFIEQRFALAQSINMLTKKDFDVKFFTWESNIPNPVAPMLQMLKPLKNDLLKGDPGARLGHEGEIVATKRKELKLFALPPFQRLLIVLALPGLFRALLHVIQNRMG